MSDVPIIDVGSVRNLVCQRHEWALAADRSVNSIAFPIEVLNAAVRDPRCIAACRAAEPGDVERIGPFLVSVAPAEAWQKAREAGTGSRGES